MPRGRSAEDLSTLQMALVGYQMEKRRIDDRIREIEARLGGKAPCRFRYCRRIEGKGVKRVSKSGGAEAHRCGAEEALGRSIEEKMAAGKSE